MLTVAATLKAQERNIVDYVTDACLAALQSHPAPHCSPTASAPHAFRPERPERLRPAFGVGEELRP
jgi:hypothetical protein